MGSQWYGSLIRFGVRLTLTNYRHRSKLIVAVAQHLRHKTSRGAWGSGLGLAIGPVVFAVDHKSDSLGLQQDLAAASRERYIHIFAKLSALQQIVAAACGDPLCRVHLAICSILDSCLDIR